MPNSPTVPSDDRTPPVEVRFTDFDRLAAFFCGWDGRFEQISAGPFEGHLCAARGEVVRVTSVEGNQVILARGRAAPGLFSLYLVSERNAGGLWHGRRLDPGRVVLHGTDAETDHRSAGSVSPWGCRCRRPRWTESPGC